MRDAGKVRSDGDDEEEERKAVVMVSNAVALILVATGNR